MSEGFGKSVVQQIEEESGEQRQLQVVEAIARTGVQDPEAIAEYLSEFKATKELAQNQEEFSLRIKAIRRNLELTADERLRPDGRPQSRLEIGMQSSPASSGARQISASQRRRKLSSAGPTP